MVAYWFLFPLLLGATFAGLGLGVRRLSVPFPPALVVPVGYSVAIMLAAIVTWSGHTTDAAGPVVGLLGLVGWAFAAGDIKRAVKNGALRRAWPWIASGVLAFLVFGAPELFYGKPSYTGYNSIVDIASQMDWASYLAEFGRHQTADNSFYLNSVNGTPLNGYPGGPQALLGTFPGAFGFAMPWSWDPYLAMMAACVVVGAYALIRQVTDSRVFAAVGAFAVGQASPMIGYGHIGGIKELSAAVMILAAGALLPSVAAPEDARPWRAALPFSIALAGAFSIFSLTILPWLGILALAAALIIWRTVSLRAALVRGGIAMGVFLVITLPTSIPAKDSLRFAKLMVKEGGNLADPVSLWAATGVWITDDHRYTMIGGGRTASIVIGVIVILLAAVGLWHAWRKRAPAIVAVFAASFIGMTLLVVRMAQWVEFKGMVLMAPVSLLLAVVGLAGVRAFGKKGLSVAAWVGVAGLVAVGVYSDALRQGSTQMAPHDRLMELRGYGKEFAGTRLTLIPDWDENGGHEMRMANAFQAFNRPFEPSADWAENPERPADQYAWDLDQLAPPFVNNFDLIVMRRSPGQSRPGRAFQLLKQGKYFEVWKRTAEAPTAAHIPMTGVATPEEKAKCEAFLKSQPGAASVTIAPAVPYWASPQFDPAKTSKGLEVLDYDPGAVGFNGNAGTSEGVVNIGASAGLFDVFVNAVTQRRATVWVNDQKFDVDVDPSAAPRPQYLGTISLADNVHTVKVEIGGTTLRPGSGRKYNQSNYINNLQLIPTGTLHPPLISGRADSLTCPDAIDWIETP